jgi:hypothetical protein
LSNVKKKYDLEARTAKFEEAIIAFVRIKQILDFGFWD